ESFAKPVFFTVGAITGCRGRKASSAGWILTGTEDSHWLVGRPLASVCIGFLNSRVIVVEFASGWSGLYCFAQLVFDTSGVFASSGMLSCCLWTIRLKLLSDFTRVVVFPSTTFFTNERLTL
ncbi:hypothetical protein R7X12_03020, partial [Mesomycoplasma ovipneumoniae]|uniref:hypothetical protein n=1 Tax=Mesomycoplasma ovipneumoniae TaxID=29562 RepID=UPI0029640417